MRLNSGVVNDCLDSSCPFLQIKQNLVKTFKHVDQLSFCSAALVCIGKAAVREAMFSVSLEGRRQTLPAPWPPGQVTPETLQMQVTDKVSKTLLDPGNQ